MAEQPNPFDKQVRAAAAAIANARGMRRGAPLVSNILDVLPENLRAEVMEDAAAAVKAATIAGTLALGATGEFPAGQFSDADEGGLKCALAADKARQRLLLHFGTPVAWVAMTAAEARAFAAALVEKAKSLDGGEGSAS